MTELRNQALELFNNSISAVRADSLIRKAVTLQNGELTINGVKFPLFSFNKIFVIGFGKASSLMASEIEKILPGKITKGLVITKYGHTKKCEVIKVLEAGHPITDRKSLSASEMLTELCKEADGKTLVLCLISGGGSALFEKLPEQIPLESYQKIIELLLRSGADIGEINLIRKAISEVKGGKLLRYIHPAKCVSIIISDVTGDPVDMIASGPTVSSAIDYRRAMDILSEYRITDNAEKCIIDYLKEKSLKNDTEEPDTKSPNFVIGNIKDALAEIKKSAELKGYKTVCISDEISGNVSDVAYDVYEKIKKVLSENSSGKVCFYGGGETTVKITGRAGAGGRNQHLALLMSVLLKDINRKFVFLSCGTDGTDGNTDDSGAIIDNGIYIKAEDLNLDITRYLENFDSGSFFRKTGGVISVEKGLTNVMDLIVMLTE